MLPLHYRTITVVGLRRNYVILDTLPLTLHVNEIAFLTDFVQHRELADNSKLLPAYRLSGFVVAYDHTGITSTTPASRGEPSSTWLRSQHTLRGLHSSCNWRFWSGALRTQCSPAHA